MGTVSPIPLEPRRSSLTSTAGLSLIELMAAVMVVGILSAIALPAYHRSVQKAKMAEAELAVADVYNLEAKRFIETATYSTDLDTIGYDTPLKYYKVTVLPGDEVGSGGIIYRVVATGLTPDLETLVLTIHEDGTPERWHGSAEAAVALGYVPGIALASAGASGSSSGGSGDSGGSGGSSGSSSDSSAPAAASSSDSSSTPSASPDGSTGGGSPAGEAAPVAVAAASDDSDPGKKEKKEKDKKDKDHNDPHCFPASNCKGKSSP